jgi:hypothetical protein
MYVYLRSEPQLWTVGFYDPTGKFVSESDHNTRELAATRVHWLNGGNEHTVSEREQLMRDVYTDKADEGSSWGEYQHFKKGHQPK